MTETPFIPQVISAPLDMHTLRVIAEATPLNMWVADAHGHIYYNTQWRDYTGLSFEDLQDNGWFGIIHPDDREEFSCVRQSFLTTGEDFRVETRLRRKDGIYRWHACRGSAQRDSDDNIVLWVMTSSDVDDKRRAEQAVRESEYRLRALVDVIPQFVWVHHPDGSAEYSNQRCRDYTNMTSEQIRGDGWIQSMHPDDRPRVLNVWQTGVQTGMPYEVEHRIQNGRTGEYRWFLVRGMPYKDAQGTILRWFGTGTDIDAQKRTEEALRQSQQLAHTFMNSNIIGIFLAEEDEVVEANDTFLRMTGYTQDDLYRREINWARMTPPEYTTLTQQAHQELTLRQYMTPYEKEYVCKDGSRLPVLVGAVTLQLNPLQVINFVLDNSARKELEQRKDDFISMASHELKTPLTSLKALIQLQQRKLARHNVQDAATTLTKMDTQVDKLTRLIGELLDVSKINAGRMECAQEPIEIDELLGEIVESLQQTTETHRIVVHGTARKSIVGDRDRLGQVFTNLITNAIKYSPQADTVEVDVTSSDEMVTISVRDFGIGIPSEQRTKIFERFYRVHDVHDPTFKGLGIGLYISADIVKRHGGNISVESVLGKGSTFQVTLPLTRQSER